MKKFLSEDKGMRKYEVLSFIECFICYIFCMVLPMATNFTTDEEMLFVLLGLSTFASFLEHLGYDPDFLDARLILFIANFTSLIGIVSIQVWLISLFVKNNLLFYERLDTFTFSLYISPKCIWLIPAFILIFLPIFFKIYDKRHLNS